MGLLLALPGDKGLLAFGGEGLRGNVLEPVRRRTGKLILEILTFSPPGLATGDWSPP